MRAADGDASDPDDVRKGEPVYLAKQVATIDQMSGGRFIMAVGIGAYREEFEAWVGNRYERPHRGEMMEEGISIFKKLMSEKISSFDGRSARADTPDISTARPSTRPAWNVKEGLSLA